MLYAISTASSVLKYIDNCDVESDVSKSLCINLISSGITEFIYADIFCVASDFVKPETSIFFIYTPFAIVVLFILINENVQKIIIVNNMKIDHFLMLFLLYYFLLYYLLLYFLLLLLP